MTEFRILGPLEVQENGRLAPLGGTRQRAVLAILLLHRGEVVSVDRLVDELWGESPPDTATKTVQVYISRLRKELGHGVVTTRGGGYVLDVDADQLDADRFERLTGEGRESLERGEARTASDLLREALGLWRGPPLGDLAYESFVLSEVARLEELRMVALEHRIEADLALGEHASLIPELETLVREHPARERLRAQLILALYRSGRQTDALATYRDTRRALMEELGVEPSRELQELERAMLTQDPELDAPARTRRPGATPRARRGGVLVALGGGLLLAVAAVAVFAGGEGDSDATSATANSIAVIDPDTNRVEDTIPTGIRPADVAAGAGYVWVANEADNTVTQINPRRRAAVSTNAPPDATVAGLAVGPDGVWIGGERRLLRLNPGFRSFERSITLEPPDEHTGYAGSNLVAVGYGSVWVGSDYGAVARVDPDTREVDTVSLGNSPSAIATGAGGVWVTDDVDNTVARIDPASANAVTATTPVGLGPSAVATGAGAVWVANTQDNTVVRIDPRTAIATDRIPVGRRPTGVAVGKGAVWVANSLSGTVSRIDPRDREVEETIETGEAPQSLTVAHGMVWVSVHAGAARGPKSTERGRVARLLQLHDEGPVDPAVDFDLQRQSAICARLYNYPDRPYPEGARPRPEVAEGPPSVSPDGRTYEFRLRRGFRFSPPSNEPVTAEAFERAFERALSPRMGSGAGGFLVDIVGAGDYMAGRTRRIAGVSARGTRLVIRLERPIPDLIARLATPFYCSVPPDTPIKRGGVDVVPSAGPYYVASRVPDRSLVLRRNPNYDGPRPQRLAEIRYTFGVREEKAVAAVEAGRADYVELNPQNFTPGVPAQLRRRLIGRYGAHSEAARAGSQQLFTQPSLSTYSFVFNTSRGPFTDPRLRRAVNFAMDRRALAEHTGGGEVGLPTDQFIPPGLPGFEDTAIYPLGRPDLASARRLAGGARRQAVLYTCKLPGCTRHAQILKSNLRAIGIELEVRQLSIGEMFKRLEDPSEPFDIGYSNWFADYADPFAYINTQYAREGGIRPGVFEDPAYERRMADAARLTGDARLRAYAKLDRDLAADAAPAAPFAAGVTTYFLSARMGCQVLHPIYGLDLAALCIKRR